ncbi:CTP synthase [Microgenomates group bacterium RBG_16_45_19]|nr:MAG: CTP synthase [Microgenomates group bacterium RBG_16_45_19]
MPLRTKYIFVSGGVLSGVGKGTVTASLALLLKSHGYRVTVVKCENYLNLDAGLINPIEHGDPFLCEDGAETDMDIGTYEKFLNQNLGLDNFITMGQIYHQVINQERNFFYRGEDVEAIPHVTDEIIRRIHVAADKDEAEICVVELGGTAGEYQNALYYEAARLMTAVNQTTVIHVHVSYLPTPPHLGEPKTKPTQLSVKTLNSMGIQPNFIVARSTARLDQRRRQRFSLFCSVTPSHIIDAPDLSSVYELPLILADQNFDQLLLKDMGLRAKPRQMSAWKSLVKKIQSPKKGQVKIAIVGKYFATGAYHLRDAYAALYDALDHATLFHDLTLEVIGLDSHKETDLPAQLKVADGIIVPIGWGPRGVPGKLAAIQYAREHQVPYLGLCFGMQLAVVEFARHLLNLKTAHSTEIDPHTQDPVIHSIPFDPKYQRIKGDGTSMRLGSYDCLVKPKTLTYQIYAKHHGFINPAKGLVAERHRHRYEVNNTYRQTLATAGLVFSGVSPDNFFVEMIELPPKIHPFFIGTQGHPEYKSRPLKPHPLFLEFIRAAYLHHHQGRLAKT